MFVWLYAFVEHTRMRLCGCVCVCVRACKCYANYAHSRRERMCELHTYVHSACMYAFRSLVRSYFQFERARPRCRVSHSNARPAWPERIRVRQRTRNLRSAHTHTLTSIRGRSRVRHPRLGRAHSKRSRAAAALGLHRAAPLGRSHSFNVCHFRIATINASNWNNNYYWAEPVEPNQCRTILDRQEVCTRSRSNSRPKFGTPTTWLNNQHPKLSSYFAERARSHLRPVPRPRCRISADIVNAAWIITKMAAIIRSDRMLSCSRVAEL